MELNYLKIKKFIPVLLILTSVLILFFFTMPVFNKIKNLRSIIKTKQTEFQNQQERLRSFEEFQKTNGFEKLNQILPNQPEIPELMMQLETMASQNNLILKTINFTEAQNEITGQITLAGSYQDLKNYLQALENNLRLIDVINLNFRAAKEESVYDFNLTLKAYYGSKQETKNIAD